MEALYLKSARKAQEVKTDFIRYLYYEIRWHNRLIAIKGARGSGKTTLLLQRLKLDLPSQESLYVSMDDLFFTTHNLYDTAQQHYLQGGRYLLLDEVHKYPNWSREIKLIYDDFPTLQIVFTSSSILEIYRGESDLSRRAITYTLKELSFREFIYMNGGPQLPHHSLEDILNRHVEISSELLLKIKPIPLFQKFNRLGAYPYFQEDEATYDNRLLQNVILIIEVDIMAVAGTDYQMAVMLKKLLRSIATSVPFTPNISKLSSLLEVSRPTLLKGLELLAKARLLNAIHKASTGIGALTKPSKLLLNNANLLYLIGHENYNIGTIRETFVVNQLENHHSILIPESGDFLIDESITVEIGGRGKKSNQIANINNSYILRDNIEIGHGNIIPLWLFGMLY